MYALEPVRMSTSREKTGRWIAWVFPSFVEGETRNRERHKSNSERGSHHETRHVAIMPRTLQVVPSRRPESANVR